jgi:hypothetical protein
MSRRGWRSCEFDAQDGVIIAASGAPTISQIRRARLVFRRFFVRPEEPR